MELTVRSTDLPDCYELAYSRQTDLRGSFVKLFQEPVFRRAGLRTDFREQYVTHSRRNALRGLHFQVPPADHAKLVVCLEGNVFDVVVDLRRGSPTYKRSTCFDLRAETATAVYLPPGFAHGFLTRSSRAMMLYMVTSVHSPEHDRGLLWSSVGIDWPAVNGEVLVSERDRQFPSLSEWDSPFQYDRL